MWNRWVFKADGVKGRGSDRWLEQGDVQNEVNQESGQNGVDEKKRADSTDKVIEKQWLAIYKEDIQMVELGRQQMSSVLYM